MIEKKKLRKLWYAFPCIIIAVSLLVYVYAFTSSWSSPVYIVTTNPNIKVYWDSACTNPVTSIDFGNIQQGAFEEFRLFIKNEGGGDVYIYWNSTVASDTGGKISDWWSIHPYHKRGNFGHHGWNGTQLLESGAVLDTWYMILVSLDTPLSSYSWTLQVGVA